MRFHAPDEPTGWARAVRRAALKRGHVQTPAADVAFIRCLTLEPQRSKAFALSQRYPVSLPNRSEIGWYDDKRRQVEPLKPWAPQTWLIERPEDAPRWPDFPFISKAHAGAQSRNVRLIHKPQAALDELTMAFRGGGIPIIPDGMQTGYVLWQKLIRTPGYDWRIVRTGDYLFGLRRHERSPAQPFASGSGRFDLITRITPSVQRAMEMTVEISNALGSRWQAYDFAECADTGRMYCLEMSCAWVDSAYRDCPLFAVDGLEPVGRTARYWPEIAVDEMERLCANN